MNMKKILVLVSCFAIVACISVGATLAYLTDTEGVTNTFTVGKVGLSLDEAKTDIDGVKNDPEVRIPNDTDNSTGNNYKLMPGHEYAKDPIVHVDADSEPCWLFVKVVNPLAEIEVGTTIAQQMETNHWKPLTSVENVYYQMHATKQNTVKDYPVFEKFVINGENLLNGKPAEADRKDGKFYIGDYDEAEIKVTAYAIQLDGFNKSEKNEIENAKAAWDAGEFN